MNVGVALPQLLRDLGLELGERGEPELGLGADAPVPDLHGLVDSPAGGVPELRGVRRSVTTLHTERPRALALGDVTDFEEGEGRHIT
jgi:hypothetical protein